MRYAVHTVAGKPVIVATTHLKEILTAISENKPVVEFHVLNDDTGLRHFVQIPTASIGQIFGPGERPDWDTMQYYMDEERLFFFDTSEEDEFDERRFVGYLRYSEEVPCCIEYRGERYRIPFDSVSACKGEAAIDAAGGADTINKGPDAMPLGRLGSGT